MWDDGSRAVPWDEGSRAVPATGSLLGGPQAEGSTGSTGFCKLLIELEAYNFPGTGNPCSQKREGLKQTPETPQTPP